MHCGFGTQIRSRINFIYQSFSEVTETKVEKDAFSNGRADLVDLNGKESLAGFLPRPVLLGCPGGSTIPMDLLVVWLFSTAARCSFTMPCNRTIVGPL